MKIKILRVSFELFRDILSEGFHPAGYSVIADAVPVDAEIVNCRCYPSWEPNCIEMQIRSESFPEIHAGQEIPIFTPQLRKEINSLV